MLLDVVRVEPQADYHLLLEFENGELRLFDMAPYLDKGVFRTLKEKHLFSAVHVEYGTVAWPGEIDMAPETLYDRSRPVPPTKSSAIEPRD